MAFKVVQLHSPVGSLVYRPALHIAPDSTLISASQAMRSNNISAVLVGPGHTAIFTERDLTRAVANECPPDTPVSEIATPLPLSVPPSTDILEAAALMLNREVRHLVVDHPDGSAGLVSLAEIVAVLLQAARPDYWLSSLRIRVGIPHSEALT